MRNLILLAAILVIPLCVKSQKKIKFNNFDQKYLTMTHCPFDSSAGAFYISEYGKSRLDHNYEIEFTHHVILKVLTPEEYDRGDIKIRFSRNDRVTGFEAVAYNMVDGEVVESKLKRKDAIIEKVNDNLNSFNFTFPNVKEGTIIEYTYKVNYGSVVRLNTWYFQRSIPVAKSQYEVIIPTYFNYERMYQGYFPLKTADVKFDILPVGSGVTTNHQIHNYIGQNIPAFKNEPYITTREDYISKIDFELKRYDLPGQPAKVFIPESFLAIGRQYYESDYWHGSVTDSKFARDVVEVLKNSNSDQTQLAESIYYYVRDNFEEDYDIDLNSQKKVFQEKKGTANQINKVLAAMMNEAGIEANLVRLSTRKNGRIWKHIAIDRQFNHTIVHINIDGERILMDATEENIPFKVLPDYCLNGEGLLISNNPEWVPLEANLNNSITYGGEFELSDGLLIGDFTRKRSGYYAWNFLDNTDDVDEYKKEFNENMETWIIDSHEVSDLIDKLTVEETLQIEVEGKLDDLGDLIYLNPIIYNQLEGNPFKSPTRSFPINYGYPISETHYYQIKLGEAYEVEELPKPLSIGLPNNGGKLIFNVSQNGDMITIMCRTQIKEVEFPAEQYAYLREFYAQKIEKQGEQIVLRRK
ncbi:DUF3857 domain-containing protein [Ekhidna sp.]|uniref:DUF3857 domain-containing protein n=1 Tax=Ekhidna sp. TaxID=2608089 RepID=UPI0032970965